MDCLFVGCFEDFEKVEVKVDLTGVKLSGLSHVGGTKDS